MIFNEYLHTIGMRINVIDRNIRCADERKSERLIQGSF